jgi:hypothetical protein
LRSSQQLPRRVAELAAEIPSHRILIGETRINPNRRQRQSCTMTSDQLPSVPKSASNQVLMWRDAEVLAK